MFFFKEIKTAIYIMFTRNTIMYVWQCVLKAVIVTDLCKHVCDNVFWKQLIVTDLCKHVCDNVFWKQLIVTDLVKHVCDNVFWKQL
jgi:hypothetical protein